MNFMLTIRDVLVQVFSALTLLGSKSSLTVKLSTIQEARLCSTQARTSSTRANIWESILGNKKKNKKIKQHDRFWLQKCLFSSKRRRRLTSSAGWSHRKSSVQSAGCCCVSRRRRELFIPDAQTASDYFHFLNLNAEFKSTDNPINKIPRCKLMNPRIQQVFVIM